MKTVLVKYKEFHDSGHWAFDGRWTEKGKVVKVNDLEELNGMFDYMTDVKVLEDHQRDLPGEKV